MPQITASPAYQQDGLLLITFDEGINDSSSCCGEVPGPAAAKPGGSEAGDGSGGGRVGAVLLSPFIKAGTVSTTAYNHYSMLGSIEDLFGVPHLGFAQLSGETDFGSDIYTSYTPPLPIPLPIPPAIIPSHAAPVTTLTAPPIAATASARAQVTLHLSATAAGGATVGSYSVQVMDLGMRNPTWRTLAASTRQTSLTFAGTAGHTYAFRAAATDTDGQTGAFATSTTVIPSGVKPTKGHYGTGWKTIKRTGAWLGQAITSSTAGAAFTLRYQGATLTLIGETTPAGEGSRSHSTVTAGPCGCTRPTCAFARRSPASPPRSAHTI